MDGTQGPQSMSPTLQELRKQEGSTVMRQAERDLPGNTQAQSLCILRNRMREIFTSGSVGGAPGNRCFYPE